jgi:uncharacterized membrane protein YjgN (DUF898 family)
LDSVTSAHAAGSGRAIEFTGNWREYLPIAVTNVLLTIVTLGIYRFWATARQRRYLWSRTHVIDDSLEWSGTGKEMFVGFLVVVAALLPFFLFIQFLFPALIARGQHVAAGIVMLIFYIAILYLTGVAGFRALRYRLSRTWWHGIRGGSNNPGWHYGAEYLGRHALSVLTLFIMFPWAATRLWNSRWNEMSFGPFHFSSDLTAEGLKGRWALLYIVPPALLMFAGVLMMGMIGSMSGPPTEARVGVFGVIFLIILMVYLAIPLLTLHWFAKFYRHAADATRLGGIEFGFDARTRDWLKLFLGNIALAVVTLGFGLAFWGYRNWSFMVRHTHLYGEVDLAKLTKSSVKAPAEAEGWADAFDVGAI